MKTLKVPPQALDQIDERVARGMEFLDDYLGGPEWVNVIDLDELDLNNVSSCVCGQLFNEDTGLRTIEDMENRAGYDYALAHVVEHGAPELETSGAAATHLGFTFGPRDEHTMESLLAEYNGYATVDDMWRDEDVWEAPSWWVVLTDRWVEHIEKRRAELGTMA